MARRSLRLRSPLALLAVLCACSLAARAAWLGQPCYSPCHSARAHLLIFDEAYYVNAARVIAGVRPPKGASYAQAPSGDDPNAEHPQLVKLAVAGLIELLGDGPVAWRLPSLLAGTLCLLGMYALVLAAGAGPWLALSAAALMAADNLLLVHGRIATLDVFALAGMLWGVAAYLRGRPLRAGLLIGVGAACKMVAPYALLVLLVLEAGRWLCGRTHLRRRALALGGCVLGAVLTLLALLSVMDRIAPPYDNSAGRLVRGGPLGHLAHMFSYAAAQTSPHGPRGIASYPWAWLVDLKPITYLNIDPAHPSTGLYSVEPAVHFLGVISPPILLAGLIGLLVAGWQASRGWRAGAAEGGRPWGGREGGRRWGGAQNAPPAAGDGPATLALLAPAWVLGTWLPFAALSLFWSRTSYLYYMVIVMPGLYLAAVQLAARLARHRVLVGLWVAVVAVAAVVLYPFTPLP